MHDLLIHLRLLRRHLFECYIFSVQTNNWNYNCHFNNYNYYCLWWTKSNYFTITTVQSTTTTEQLGSRATCDVFYYSHYIDVPHRFDLYCLPPCKPAFIHRYSPNCGLPAESDQIKEHSKRDVETFLCRRYLITHDFGLHVILVYT